MSSRIKTLMVGAALAALAVGLPVSRQASTDAAAATGDPVIAAVGDMACDPDSPSFNQGAGTSTACGQGRVSDAMLGDSLIGGVLGLGDYQYDCDDASDFAVSYTPTWGRLGDRITPVAGNHEYQTGTDAFGSTCPASNATAQTFFDYFANSHPETTGHFSFDLGSWHIIGLNGNCGRAGGCSATSAQATWLKQDLAASTAPCTLAYWHQPLFTGMSKSVATAYRAWWNELYAAHADVVLNGHVHDYQRFAPLSPSGARDPSGVTEYIVGTGGEKQVEVASGSSPHPVADAKQFGYLRMTLHQTGWTSEFVEPDGTIFDTSSGTCHEAAPTSTATPTPTPASSTNLLPNSSVEASGQYFLGKYSQTSQVSWYAGEGYDGTHSVSIRNGAATRPKSAGMKQTPEQVSTVAGTTYHASAWVRSTVPGQKVALRLRETGQSGQLSTVTLPDTGWHQVTVSCTARGTGNRLGYAVIAKGEDPATTIYADQFSVTS